MERRLIVDEARHMPAVTGSTRLLPLIGHPVTQVKSPATFNAHFSERKMDAIIFPVDLPDNAVDGFFANLASWTNCIGCSVTIPYKQRAYTGIPERTPRAELVGAVNIVRREADGKLVGDMTDGLAMLAALERAGFSAVGRHALVVGGGGGAGAAIVFALAEAGINELTILESNPGRRMRLFEGLALHFPSIALWDAFTDARSIDLAINASPLGMKPGDPLPIDPSVLAPGSLVADVVTEPAETAFLMAARSRGITSVSGLDMIHWQLPFQMQHLGLPF